MPTQLLNDDGTASIATLLMCSHHAFRRDVACFASALAAFEPARAPALRAEWTLFRAALHGHHSSEDSAVFPDLRGRRPGLAAALDALEAHHRAIDPWLERGDRAFAELADDTRAAREVIAALAALLDDHLDAEERAIMPELRDARQFPLPPTAEVIAAYADGFAWSSAGISPRVLDQVFAMLPAALAAAIPAARAAFDERSRRVWGHVHTGASQTSVPASR